MDYISQHQYVGLEFWYHEFPQYELQEAGDLLHVLTHSLKTAKENQT